MDKQNRRLSTGYIPTRRNVVGLHPARRPTYPPANNISAESKHVCSCNVGTLREELESLRQSTKNSLHQSWDEVESLNTKCTDQESLIQRLQDALDAALNHETKLERKLAEIKKELQRVTDLHNATDSNAEFEGMPRTMSFNALAAGLASLDFSNHSLPTFRLSDPPKEWQSTSTQTADSCPSVVNTAQNSPETLLDFSRHTLSSVGESEQLNLKNAAYNLEFSRHTVTLGSVEEYDQLKLKLEQREQEIQALEEVIRENTKSFQELHSEQKHSCN